MAAITLEAFEASLEDQAPPSGASPLLQALWHEARGDWAKAHGIAQDDEGQDGAWVHAYLHRVEGDLANAGYWYRRAGKPRPEAPLREEWCAIVGELLGR
jgi:hypothetical protein